MRALPLFIFLLVSLSSWGQVIKPINWSFSASKKEVKVGEQVELIFNATIDNGWYLYSSDFDPDLGPTVTTFTFTPNDSYQLVGKIKAVNPKKKYDEIFDGEYTYFTGKAEFRQTVKILKPNPIIKGTYDYQVCSDVSGQCIPFDGEFSFNTIKVVAQKERLEENTEKNVASANATPTKELPSSKETQAADSTSQAIATQSKPATDSATTDIADNKPVETAILSKKEALINSADNDPYSLAAFMLVAFLTGLAALVTPCVFPMIPMTVTFFTRKSASRSQAIIRAFVYAFSIIAIYTLIGIVFSLLFGPAFPNFLSTHWLPNLFFFVVLVIFALSFLGMFDLNVPGSVISKVDAQADKGGYMGIFFMAFTIVLVSFSCTGPIVGSILVESAGGQLMKPIAGMFAFSLAFALPFGLFAIFPEWLSSLPKSGGWLNSVKVVLGFLELALALKFLSIADQVYHWGILDREIFLALWIVIFALIGFYLLGKIKTPHDAEVQRVSVPRILLAILTFAFVVYLIPGMFGAPLKPLAGYLPPQTTQEFNINQASNINLTANQTSFSENPKHSEFLKLPHGLKGFFDYQEGLAYAKKVNKPLFIDFTGHGCVNCREMEARVWSDPRVLKRLANDYVVIALYVDDKYKLPEAQWYTSPYDNRVKKTIGAQNADFQITKFKNNAQPFYVLMGHDGNPLIPPIAYDLNADTFVNFLDRGLQEFKKGNDSLIPVSASLP